VLTQERKLVSRGSLKNDLSAPNLEDAASAQSEPFCVSSVNGPPSTTASFGIILISAG